MLSTDGICDAEAQHKIYSHKYASVHCGQEYRLALH